jgi:hypothetical protein
MRYDMEFSGIVEILGTLNIGVGLDSLSSMQLGIRY